MRIYMMASGSLFYENFVLFRHLGVRVVAHDRQHKLLTGHIKYVRLTPTSHRLSFYHNKRNGNNLISAAVTRRPPYLLRHHILSLYLNIVQLKCISIIEHSGIYQSIYMFII